jgi:hypothetical protein
MKQHTKKCIIAPCMAEEKQEEARSYSLSEKGRK